MSLFLKGLGYRPAPRGWDMCFPVAYTVFVVHRLRFQDISYADDLNAFQSYLNHLREEYLLSDLRLVQKRLHLWREANGVRFDANKESLEVTRMVETSRC